MFLKNLPSIVLSLSLVACGGGGDSTNGPSGVKLNDGGGTASNANLVKSTWRGECISMSGGFGREELAFSEQAFAVNVFKYEDASCQGKVTVSNRGVVSGSFSLGQNVTLESGHEGQHIDFKLKRSGSSQSITVLDVVVISSGKLYLGTNIADVRANTRPSKVVFGRPYEKI